MSQSKMDYFRFLIKPIIKPAVLGILNGIDRLYPGRRPVPILAYHSLDESGSVISLSPSAFRGQIQFLRRKGYRLLSLAEYARKLRMKEVFPSSAAVLTFDDGYENFFTQGAPILEEAGFRATVFVQTGLIGKRSCFSSHLDLPLLNSGQVKELASAGFEIGAHTVSHPHLSRLTRAEAGRELKDSKIHLESLIGRKVDSFCYPYGDYSPALAELVAETGFESAVTLRPGNRNVNKDIFSLKRLVVPAGCRRDYFSLALSSFYCFYNRIFQIS